MTYPDLIIERTYAQWIEVIGQAQHDEPFVAGTKAVVGGRLLGYCRRNHLRVVAPVRYRVEIQEPVLTGRSSTLVLAECRAQGLPPVNRKRRWFRRNP